MEHITIFIRATTISLIIIGAAIVVKVVLGRYVKYVGEKVNSGSLIASGTDALFDAVLSTSVLISALIFIAWGVSLEAYVGAIISVFIIKSGIEMIRDAVDEILGKRADKELTDGIKATICEDENVLGAYDLIIHNYGPDRMIGSVHIEVPGDMDAVQLDAIERDIAKRVFMKHGVIIAGVGIYANDASDDIQSMRSEITRIVMSHEEVLQMHGFKVDREKMLINLDIIIDYDIKEREPLYAEICGEIQKAYPEYRLELVLDIDI